MAVFNSSYEGLYLTEIALRIDLVVRKYWIKVISRIEMFDGFIMGVNFLAWNTEEGGGF